MDNFTENTDKHSLYVLRNFTAVTFAALLIAGSTLSILGITMTIVPKWFNIMLLLLTVSGGHTGTVAPHITCNAAVILYHRVCH